MAKSAKTGVAVASSAELRAWSRLVAGVADAVVAGTVQDMHEAISRGTFRRIGPLARPVQRIVEPMTSTVYALVRGSLRAAGELAAAASDRFGTPADETGSRATRKAAAIAHGVVDAELLALAPELDLDLGPRVAGRTHGLTPAALRTAYPAADGRLVVFVHGLVDTEDVWSAVAGSGTSLPTLARASGATPVMVRYGTGHPVGRSGAQLAVLLESLAESWPVPVTGIVLVGHSMGGLVARSACFSAIDQRHRWPAMLTDVIYLGTPHLGSWLEKAANIGSWTLRTAASSSAPLGTLLDSRSRGIKDLRHGSLAEDDWGSSAPDGLLTGLVADGPWLDDVTHHLVVGRLRPTVGHPLNHAFGDALVRAGSASGRGRRRSIGVGGPVLVHPVAANHTRLVRDPGVAEVLREVLAEAADESDGERADPVGE